MTKRPEFVVAAELGESGHAVGAGNHGLDWLGALCSGIFVPVDGDGLLPLDFPLWHGLPVVGVGVEIANQAGDFEALEATGKGGLTVFPRYLAVGGEVNAGVDLFLDDVGGDLTDDPFEVFLGGSPGIHLGDGAADIGPVGSGRQLWMVSDNGS